MSPPRTFGLAKLIENAPAHRPKRYRPHLADADKGDLWTATELRRHLRGGTRAFAEMASRGRR